MTDVVVMWPTILLGLPLLAVLGYVLWKLFRALRKWNP